MSAPHPAPTAPPAPAVPTHARALAARLSALFLEDQAIAVRQADAQRRLTDANDRLWSGLAGDAFGLISVGAAPAGRSQITKPIGPRPGSHCTLLGGPQEAHWAIHRAFCAYQSACEERRQLAADIGETIRQFLDALVSAGWSEDQARNANVHQLAARIGDGETG